MITKLASFIAVTLFFVGMGLGAVNAQTYSSTSPATDTSVTSTTTTTSSVGVPSTGDGGNSTKNIGILLTSAIVAVGGVAYLSCRLKII